MTPRARRRAVRSPHLDPIDFEDLVAALFKAMGMEVMTTERSGDVGRCASAVKRDLRLYPSLRRQVDHSNRRGDMHVSQDRSSGHRQRAGDDRVR